jgi:hypothetical protein
MQKTSQKWKVGRIRSNSAHDYGSAPAPSAAAGGKIVQERFGKIETPCGTPAGAMNKMRSQPSKDSINIFANKPSRL